MMNSGKTIIGITGGLGAEWARGGESFSTYAAAVESAGAIAVPLGHGRHARYDEVDGLLVSGGCDLDPKHTDPLPGDENLTRAQVMEKYRIKTEPRRDEVEMRMTNQALKEGKPFLGICRGFQVLNIVVGRRLIGDILTWDPKALRHFAQEGVSASHEIEIARDSIIERSYGAKTITVNSRHHQGIRPEFVSEKLRVTAIAPDGIAEAVEFIGANFVVGVQWHPEKKVDEYINSVSGSLFKSFVDASAQWRCSR